MVHVNFRISRTSIKGILRIDIHRKGVGGNHEIWYSVPCDSRAKVLSIRFTVGHGFLRTRLTGDCKGSMGAKAPKPHCLSCWVKDPNSRKCSEGLLNKRVALLVQMTFTAQHCSAQSCGRAAVQFSQKDAKFRGIFELGTRNVSKTRDSWEQ